MARDGEKVTLKMPSGEQRQFLGRCMATVGQVGNGEMEGLMLGKAGRKRWLGIRPTVRGVAMNPVDHPMGGGEGRTSGGGPARSPWGKLAKGGKTRKPRKASDRLILKRRK
jgi:large subunit ribosomal protein L2